MAIARTKEQKAAGLSLEQARAANAGKSDAEIKSGKATVAPKVPAAPTITTPGPINPPAPASPGQAYEYIAKDNTTKRVTASSPEEASRLALDIAPHSGVALAKPLIQQTTTQLRTQNDQNTMDLQARLARTGTTADAGTKTAHVVKDMDNGDGTRTVTYDDGTSARVNVTKNADGSDSYKEVGDKTGTADDEDDPYGLNEKTNSLTANIQAEKKRVTQTLDSISSQMRGASQNLIAGLKQMYAARTDAMIQSNQRLLKAQTTAGLREGRARYVQGVQTGLLTDEEQAGEQRLASMQAELLKGIAEAENASAKDQMTLLQSKMTALGDLDDRLENEVKNLWDKAVERDQQIRANEKAQQDAEKSDLDNQTTKAEKSADAVAEALDSFATLEEKNAFISSYSKNAGIEPAYLISAVNEARRAKGKDELSMANTKNEIYNRNRAEDRQQRAEDFNPSAADEAKVGKYLATHGSDSDTKKAKEDPDFFYYILSKTDEDI